MRRSADPAARRCAGDEGVVSAFVVIFAVALVFMAALVVDGGRMLSEHRHTGNLADSAARAGAQQISADAIRAGRAEVLDEEAAEEAACDFLAHSGHACDGSDTFASADGNEVTVQVTGSIDLLLLAGGPQVVRNEGTACVALGITDATTVC
jgi:uncharacterized membrane protein